MALLSARNLIIGGLALGAAYAAKNRRAASGLLGGGQGTPEPYPAPAAAPVGARSAEPGPSPAPAVANADVAGPPENTSTHVPAAEPTIHEPAGGIDELAEEEAAAAEAANIGGTPEDYPSEEDASIQIDEELRPVEEAGGGFSEGQELAESDLVENAEPAAGDPIEAERQIDEIIQLQDDLSSGEAEEATLQMPIVEENEPEQVARDLGEPEAEELPPLAPDPADEEIIAPPPTGEPAVDLPPPPETSPEEKSSAVWRIEEPPATEAEPVPEDDGPSRTEDGA